MLKRLSTLAIFLLFFAGCKTSAKTADDTGSEADTVLYDGSGDTAIASNDIDDGADTKALLPYPTNWFIHHDPAADEWLISLADEAVELLTESGIVVQRKSSTKAPICEAGKVHIILGGDGLGVVKYREDEIQPNTWGLRQELCDDGALLVLYGGGVLGRQFALYGWLHQLGFRFFHPQQTYVPSILSWNGSDRHEEVTPVTPIRSIGIRSQSGAPILDGLDGTRPEEGKATLRWLLRNMANTLSVPISDDAIAQWAAERGIQRRMVLSLYDGPEPLIVQADDEEAPWLEPLQTALSEIAPMSLSTLDLRFAGSAMLGLEPGDVLAHLQNIADWMMANHPGVRVAAKVPMHAATVDTEFGIPYVLIPTLAGLNLGITIETTLAYDLSRPNGGLVKSHALENLQTLLGEFAWRKVSYEGAGARLGGYDMDLPIGLPLALDGHAKDLGPAIVHSFYGIHSHGSGHEWTFWAQDYCLLKMARDGDQNMQPCLDALMSPMGPVAQQMGTLLKAVIAVQERDLLLGGLWPWLAAAEPASLAPAILTPRPTMEDIMLWDFETVEAWENTTGMALNRCTHDMEKLTGALALLHPLISPREEGFYTEWLDSVEAFSTRAKHAAKLFGGLVALRKGQLTYKKADQTHAKTDISSIADATHQALAIVKRRESNYRYTPLSRYVEEGAQLQPTTTVAYYRQEDASAMEITDAMEGRVTLSNAFLLTGEILDVSVVDIIPEEEEEPLSLTKIKVDFGDGEVSKEGALTHSHHYDQPGVYTLRATWDDGEQKLAFLAQVMVFDTMSHTGKSGKVVDPSQASLLEPFLPALTLGSTGPEDLFVGYHFSNEDTVLLGHHSRFTCNADGECSADRFLVPIGGGDEATTSVVIFNATATVNWEAGSLTIVGVVLTEILLDTVVELVGFTPEDALDTIAALLGYDPEAMPETLMFTIAYDLPTPEDTP